MERIITEVKDNVQKELIIRAKKRWTKARIFKGVISYQTYKRVATTDQYKEIMDIIKSNEEERLSKLKRKMFIISKL